MEGVERRFVGRAVQLEELRGLVEESAAGRGRLAVVSGEAGIGKTRLCQELSVRATERGFGVAWAACWEPSGLPPLWPWVQLLVQLGSPMPENSAEGSDPEVARATLFASVAALLQRAGRARPWLLVIDDVQWAEPATIRLLASLAPLVRSMRILIAVTLRTGTDAPSPLGLSLGRLGKVVSVEPMSVDEVHELVTVVLDGDPGAAAAAAVHRATAGNPLFAAELARRLQRDESFGALLADDDFAVPPTVRAVLDERLATVSGHCRELLEYGAVVGQEFPLPVVANAAGRPLAEALAAADEAAAAGIVTTVALDVSFTHPLLRAVVYDDIGVARRVELHRRVGEALERRGVERSDSGLLPALSHHYLLAAPTGTATRAAHFSILAARQALTALAPDEAIQFYGAALTALDLDPAGWDRGELLVEVAAAHAAAGDAAAARALYLDGAEHARTAGRAEQLAVAALGLAGAGFEVALFDDVQVSLLEEALAVLDDDNVIVHARLRARLSVALSLTGQDDRRSALAASAVQLATRSGDDAALAAALAARCDAQAGPDYVERRMADAETIVAISQRRGDRATELLGRRLRLLARLEAGDLPAVDREIYEFAQLADWLRQPAYRWYPTLWRAMRAATRGRTAEQAALANESEAMGRAVKSPNVEILLLAHRHFVSLEIGDLDTYLAETERWAPPGAWEELGIQMLPLAVMRALFGGRPDEARAILDRSAEVLRSAPKDAEWLTLLAQIGDLCAKLGGHHLATWLYDTLLPYAGLWSVDGIGAYAHGPLHRQLGTLAVLLGRPDEAREHFDAALAGNRAAGAELLAARTLLDRGVALGEPTALEAARAAYRGLGIDRRVAEIDRLLAPTPAPAGSNSLRREGEIWAVTFAGRQCRVRDSKGIRDLARLLAEPGRGIAAVDLVSPTGSLGQGDLGETVDAAARAAYKGRLVQLASDLDKADRAGDAERSAGLHAEREALVAQLSSAYGLGGRPRRSGDPAERARTAVTARIRDAIGRIESADPEVGRHLRRAVRTGTICVYDPDPPVAWTD